MVDTFKDIEILYKLIILSYKCCVFYMLYPLAKVSISLKGKKKEKKKHAITIFDRG